MNLRLHISLFKRFLKEGKAATAVEFAITAPLYLFTLLGAFELAIILLSSVVLEGAVSNAARENITGSSSESETRAQMLQRIIKQDTIGVLDQKKILLTSRSFVSFREMTAAERQSAGMPELVGESLNPGGAGELVLFKIVYDWKSITPFFGAVSESGLMREASVFRITSYALVKNEPF